MNAELLPGRLVAGRGIGAVAVWLILKAKIQAAADSTKAEAGVERVGLWKTTRTIQAAELLALPAATDTQTN